MRVSEDLPQTPEQRAAQAKAHVLVHPKVNERSALNWGALEQRGTPPAREWAADHWLGMGHVTVLFGRGSIGKSLLCQQWASSLALGVPFITPVAQARTVLMWASEDDHDELWRRQCAIAQAAGRELTEYGRFTILPLADAECTLLDTTSYGELVRTSILEELREQIGDLKVEVVILDNIARLFGGNENDRHDVTAFIAALQYAAAPTKAAIMLLGHVARAQGSEFAGSAAWENAARARLWMTDRPPDKPLSKLEEEDSVADETLRYLAKRKVNYSARDLCLLRWQQGAYNVVTPPAPGGIVRSIAANAARRVVMAAHSRLVAMNLQPTASTSSPNFLPKLICQHKFNEGHTTHDLAGAMRELMNDGELRQAVIGTNSNRTPRTGLVRGDNGQAA